MQLIFFIKRKYARDKVKENKLGENYISIKRIKDRNIVFLSFYYLEIISQIRELISVGFSTDNPSIKRACA